MLNKKFYIFLIFSIHSTILPSLHKYAQNILVSNIHKSKLSLFSFNFPKLWENRFFLLFRRRAQLYKNKKLIIDLDPKKDRFSLLNPIILNRATDYKAIYVDGKIASRIIYAQDSFNSFHIINLATDSNFRNRGYADALLNFAIEDAINHGAEIITLHVTPHNFKAINLYKKIGFLKNPLSEHEYIYTVPKEKIKPKKFKNATDIFFRE